MKIKHSSAVGGGLWLATAVVLVGSRAAAKQYNLPVQQFGVYCGCYWGTPILRNIPTKLGYYETISETAHYEEMVSYRID